MEKKEIVNSTLIRLSNACCSIVDSLKFAFIINNLFRQICVSHSLSQTLTRICSLFQNSVLRFQTKNEWKREIVVHHVVFHLILHCILFLKHIFFADFIFIHHTFFFFNRVFYIQWHWSRSCSLSFSNNFHFIFFWF